MDPKTQQQIIEGLQAVAKKIGENADYLFRLSVRQQWINGIESLIFTGFGCVAAYCLWKLIKYCKTDKCSFDDPDFSKVISTVGLVLTIFITILFFTNAIDLILNPEYWALHSILKMFQGSN